MTTHTYAVRTSSKRGSSRRLVNATPETIANLAVMSLEAKIEWKLLGIGAPTLSTHCRHRKFWTSAQVETYNAGFGPSFIDEKLTGAIDDLSWMGEMDYERMMDSINESRAEMSGCEE